MVRRKMLKKMMAMLLSVASVIAIAGMPSALAEAAAEPEQGLVEEPLWNPPEGATIYKCDLVSSESGYIDPLTGEKVVVSENARLGQTTLLAEFDTSFYMEKGHFIVKTKSVSIENKAVSKIGLMTLKCQKEVDGVWTDKLVSSDLYEYNASEHSLTRSFIVTANYKYRIYSEHYAQDDFVLGLYSWDKKTVISKSYVLEELP